MGIWIVDFGSQYTQLITRRSREMGYKTVIISIQEAKERLSRKESPQALILSGGPHSLLDDPSDYSYLFQNRELPILGVCYGMQIIGQFFGGVVERGVLGEYGEAHLQALTDHFSHLSSHFKVWMSHAEHVSQLPKDFHLLFQTENNLIAGILSKSRPILALQFHPEVHHSEYGEDILRFFYERVAKLSVNWKEDDMIAESKRQLLQSSDGMEKGDVLCAFSGGVDSLVAAYFTQSIIGRERLHCFFVNHGLLRHQDMKHIDELKRETSLNIEVIHCEDIFLSRLRGVSEPEEKRKIIGRTFIEIFEHKVAEYQDKKHINFAYLLQGTLYPDVIESKSPHAKGGQSSTIKSHHNVGGLPQKMNLDLLEPFRFLFKDEVRQIGLSLNLPHRWLFRHPFPGPGVAIRIMGDVTDERIRKVQESDQILFEELVRQGCYDDCWQAFTVLLPLSTVGIKGDGRVYEEVIGLRMVNSRDGMTADWSRMPFDFLNSVSKRLTNEVIGITRVVYDITSKPPGTIEWE